MCASDSKSTKREIFKIQSSVHLKHLLARRDPLPPDIYFFLKAFDFQSSLTVPPNFHELLTEDVDLATIDSSGQERNFSIRTRRLSKYLKGFGCGRRDIVLLLHDFGGRDTAWFQLYGLGRSLYDTCDVDICFLEFRQAGNRPALWFSLFPVLVPHLVEAINGRKVSVVGYGKGAGLLLENLAVCGRAFACPHVLIDPELGSGTPPTEISGRVGDYFSRRTEKGRLTVLLSKPLNCSVSDIVHENSIPMESLSASDIEVKFMSDGSHSHLQFSEYLLNKISDIIMSHKNG